SAQQIYGGHGYIEDNGMSQFVRDARITMIYEGANGVQALDLVGRKLAANNGADVMAFLALGQGVVAECEACSERADLAEPLRDALAGLQQVMAYFMKSAERPNAVLAGSVDTLHLFGYTAVAVIWAQMAGAAVTRRETGELGTAFYDAKLASARYYMTRVLPAVKMHKARAMAGDLVVSY
ncbi:MAG: acyl-CoA dehydrogenase, partial [Candidatus Halichondribacter symbioticus]